MLLLSTVVHAQFGFGPEVGIGASNMRFIPDNAFTTSSANNIPSGRIGCMIDAPFTQHIYFQSGLFLSQKGHKRTYGFRVSDSTYESVDRSFNLTYIDLPLSIVFKTGEQGKGRMFLGAGATMSYLLTGNDKLHAQGKYKDTAFNVNATAPADDLLRKFDIGATFIAGYELPTGLLFKIYYTSGVKDLGKTSEVDKNRMWGVAVGYTFGRDRNINKDTEELIDKSKD